MLSFNRIELIKKLHFGSLSELLELYLNKNWISAIEKNSFEGLENLEKLDLSDNHRQKFIRLHDLFAKVISKQ